MPPNDVPASYTEADVKTPTRERYLRIFNIVYYKECVKLTPVKDLAVYLADMPYKQIDILVQMQTIV